MNQRPFTVVMGMIVNITTTNHNHKHNHMHKRNRMHNKHILIPQEVLEIMIMTTVTTTAVVVVVVEGITTTTIFTPTETTMNGNIKVATKVVAGLSILMGQIVMPGIICDDQTGGPTLHQQYQHTLSIYPINITFEPTYSTHPLNPPSHTLSTHLLYPFSQPILSSHLINPASLLTLSYPLCSRCPVVPHPHHIPSNLLQLVP